MTQLVVHQAIDCLTVIAPAMVAKYLSQRMAADADSGMLCGPVDQRREKMRRSRSRWPRGRRTWRTTAAPPLR
jgi:hypothetical protein